MATACAQWRGTPAAAYTYDASRKPMLPPSEILYRTHSNLDLNLDSSRSQLEASLATLENATPVDSSPAVSPLCAPCYLRVLNDVHLHVCHRELWQEIPARSHPDSELGVEGRVGIVAARLALRKDAQRVSVVSDARPPRYRVVESVARLRRGHVKAYSQRACGMRHEMW